MAHKVLLAAPRGFCAGVEMAIKALTWMVQVFEPPIYCYHQIVHNADVVSVFERAGVVFIDDVAELPQGAPVMLSAHGSAPGVVEAATAASAVMVDAVCPLVTKVHHEVKRMASDGFDIIYVGHEGHDEAIGTLAESPDAMTLIEPERGLGDFAPTDRGKVALVAQTTLGVHEWDGVLADARSRYPNLRTARKSDLCYATTNRQEAIRELADRSDVILVVGSENSSNTQALVRVARASGTAAHRLDGPAELDPAWLDGAETVGVTSGASAPDQAVLAVIEAVAPSTGTDVVSVLTEDEYFPLPPALRSLMSALETAVAAGYGTTADGIGGPLANDRGWTAAEALDLVGSVV